MDLSPEMLSLGAGWYIVFLLSLTCHEAGHALAAWRLGDPTAYEGGQVTLNPVPHLQREPVGTVVIPIVSFLLTGWMFGWASAPYDPHWAQRYPRRAALMALAGPAANLLLVLLAAGLIQLGIATDYFVQPDRASFHQVTMGAEEGLPERLATLVSICFMLNLLLMMFNLLPLPPLDGSAVVGMFLSREQFVRYQHAMSQPAAQLIGMLVAWRAIDYVFPPLHRFALSMLYPGTSWM